MTMYRDPGFALANITLSFHILEMLRNLELITEEEAWEVVKQALLDLETGQAAAKPEDRETFRGARIALDVMRKKLAPRSKMKQPKRPKSPKTRQTRCGRGIAD